MMNDLSRRTFLQFAAAGSAATLPAVAQAAVSCQVGDSRQLSDEEQLNTCIDQLKQILQRMNPGCDNLRVGYFPQWAGGAMVCVEALRPLEGGAV